MRVGLARLAPCTSSSLPFLTAAAAVTKVPRSGTTLSLRSSHRSSLLLKSQASPSQPLGRTTLTASSLPRRPLSTSIPTQDPAIMHPQQAVHAQSIHDREGFWLRAAQAVHWHRAPSRAYGAPSSSSGEGAEFLDRDGKTWFPDGELNVCYNVLDRHVYPPPTPASPPVSASPTTPHVARSEAGARKVALHHVSPLPFQRAQYRAVTYGEALDYVQVLAGVLRAKGVQKGDVVVIYMPMIPETALAMLAVARLGAVHSVVFGGFAAKELAKRIQDSQCKLVLSASCGLEPKGPLDYKPLVDGALQHSAHKPPAGLLWLRRHTIDGHTPAAVASSGTSAATGLPEAEWEAEMELVRAGKQGRAPVYECVPVPSQAPIFTMYTSGTTGVPKGVVRSSGGHVVGLRYSIEHAFGMRPNDTIATFSDLGWVVGHQYILYGPLLLGASSVLFEGKPILPDAGIFWRIISDLRVTQMFTAPTALRAVRGLDPSAELMRAQGVDLRSLRTLFLAGERSEPSIVAAYRELLRELAAPDARVVDNYWSTESGSPITSAALSSAFAPIDSPPGAAGMPTPGMDVRVVDDEGKEVKQGEMGNLVLAYPLHPTGLPTLWKNRAGFDKAYLAKFKGKGDWFDTGDSAVVDARGFITILARSDDIIQVAAHRLGTGLIEQVVTRHPKVIECCVVGAPDKMKGQSPFALVVAAADAAPKDGKATASSRSDPATKQLMQDINDHVRKEVGPIAQLSGLVITTRLPKTRSGKTLRRSVRAIVENAADNKPDGEIPVPPTVEDASVIPVVKDAVFAHFASNKAKL